MLVAVLAIGLLLPPTEIGLFLRPSGGPQPVGLIAGLWLLKSLLVAHAVAAWALGRWLPSVVVQAEPTPGTPTRLAIAGLLITGLLLRLPGLGRGLWFDEIQTLIDYVTQPLGVLLTTFDSTNQHLLFSTLAHLTTKIIGVNAAGLRLPAVVLGVLSLWATLSFARRWMTTRQAWWSTVVLAVSYHHVWFSQNARGYTGLLLGTLLGSTLFLDMLRGQPATSRRVWAYGWVMALAVMTHVTALVVVAAHAVCWLWQARRLPNGRPRWAPLVGLVLVGSLAAMLYAPVLPQLFGAVGSSGTAAVGVEWQRPGWFLAEAIAGLMRGLPMGIVIVPVAGLIVLVGVIDSWKRDRLVAIMMGLPLGIMALLLMLTGHNMWPRFFFFGAAFVVQWAVRGGFVVLDRLTPRWAIRLSDLGLGVVTVGSLLLLPKAWAPKQDYPAAAEWVGSHAMSGDVVVGTEMMALPMNQWLGHTWAIVRTAGELQAQELTDVTTWLLYTFPIRVESTAPELWQRIQAEYEVAHVVPASIGGGEIVIMRRAPKRSIPVPGG